MGTNFFLELRFNRPKPIDFGVQLKLSNFTQSIPNVFSVNCVLINPTLFSDYNYRLNRKTTLFAGLGFGGSISQNTTVIWTTQYDGFDGIFFGDHISTFAVTPRMGVTLGWTRLTAEYIFTDRNYSHFNLNIGIVIGGSYKNKNRVKVDPFRLLFKRPYVPPADSAVRKSTVVERKK